MSSTLGINSKYSVTETFSWTRNLFTGAKETFKRRSRTPEGRAVLMWMGMNTSIFLAWRVALRRPQSAVFMFHHFTCSRESMSIRRMHTLVTSNFSHYDPIHFSLNMFILYNVGTEVCNIITPSRFSCLYIVGGLASSVASVSLKAARRSPKASLGASGSVMACIFTYAQLFPERKAYILGKPINIQDLCIASAGVDIAGILLGLSGIDFAAHLGGAAFGYTYYRWIRASLIREQRLKRHKIEETSFHEPGHNSSILRWLRKKRTES